MNEIARSGQIVPLLQPKAVTSMNTDTDILEDDLSSAIGTKTLVAHNPVLDGLPTSRETEQQITGLFGGSSCYGIPSRAPRAAKSRDSAVRTPSWEYVNNAWSKITKYYELTDKSYQIYAVAAFLNPTQRRDFFDNSWVGKL
jgi:hypothetical protein